MSSGPPRTPTEAHELAQSLLKRGFEAEELGALRGLVAPFEDDTFGPLVDEEVRFAHFQLLSQLGSLLEDEGEALALFERMMGAEFADLMRLDTAHFPACVLGKLIYQSKDVAVAEGFAARLFDEVFDPFPSQDVGRVTAEALFNLGVLHADFDARLAIAERIEREIHAGLRDPHIAAHVAAAYANASVYGDDAGRLIVLGEHVLVTLLEPNRESDEAERIAGRAALLFGQAINFVTRPEERADIADRLDGLYAEFPTPEIAERIAWAAFVRAEAGDPGAVGAEVVERMAGLLGRHSSVALAEAAVQTSLLAFPTSGDGLLAFADRTRALVLEHTEAPKVAQVLAHIYLRIIPALLEQPDEARTALTAALELLRRAASDPEIARYPIFGGPLQLDRFPDSMRDELIRFLQEVLPG